MVVGQCPCDTSIPLSRDFLGTTESGPKTQLSTTMRKPPETQTAQPTPGGTDARSCTKAAAHAQSDPPRVVSLLFSAGSTFRRCAFAPIHPAACDTQFCRLLKATQLGKTLSLDPLPWLRARTNFQAFLFTKSGNESPSTGTQ